MAKKFARLREQMTPEQRQQARELAEKLLAEMPLQELRRARELTQEALAQALECRQPEVCKIESRTDMYVSTLRRYIEAMGGRLDIVAHFPEGDVRITQFKETDAARS